MERLRIDVNAVKFRDAAHEDYDVIAELFCEEDSLHCSALPEVFREPQRILRSRDFIEKIIDDPEKKIILAVYDDKVIGFTFVELARSPDVPLFIPRTYAKLSDVVVLKKYHGNGVGTALMKLAQEWAKEHGAHQMELNVWEFNWTARELYEKLGYRTVRRTMSKSI